MRTHPLEKLRQIWTPGREIEEVISQLEPQTELDSMLRDFLHRTIQQNGPVMLDIGSEIAPVMNVGILRWEVVHGPGPEGHRRRQVALWVEIDDD